jgi:transcriptional regulator with XRE-family HTH domain
VALAARSGFNADGCDDMESGTMRDGGEDDPVGAASAAATFGAEVRALRKTRRMTLKDLATVSGVSLSHLSAIERGASNPSLEVIDSIASALSVSPDWFFVRRSGAGPLERACVVRAHERRALNVLYGQSEHEIGYADGLLSASIGGRFYMGMARYAPGASRPDEPMLVHDGEEHGVVIEGTLELTLGDEVVTLRAGDSYSFDGRIPHHARNRSDAPAVLVWAVAPVVIPKDIRTTGDGVGSGPSTAADGPGAPPRSVRSYA